MSHDYPGATVILEGIKNENFQGKIRQGALGLTKKYHPPENCPEETTGQSLYAVPRGLPATTTAYSRGNVMKMYNPSPNGDSSPENSFLSTISPKITQFISVLSPFF